MSAKKRGRKQKQNLRNVKIQMIQLQTKLNIALSVFQRAVETTRILRDKSKCIQCKHCFEKREPAGILIQGGPEIIMNHEQITKFRKEVEEHNVNKPES